MQLHRLTFRSKAIRCRVVSRLTEFKCGSEASPISVKHTLRLPLSLRGQRPCFVSQEKCETNSGGQRPIQWSKLYPVILPSRFIARNSTQGMNGIQSMHLTCLQVHCTGCRVLRQSSPRPRSCLSCALERNRLDDGRRTLRFAVRNASQSLRQ